MILLLTCTGSYFLLYKIPSNLTQCLVRHYLHTIFILRHFTLIERYALIDTVSSMTSCIVISFMKSDLSYFLFLYQGMPLHVAHFIFHPKPHFYYLDLLLICLHVWAQFILFSQFSYFLITYIFFLLIWNYNQQFIEIRYILCIEYT